MNLYLVEMVELIFVTIALNRAQEEIENELYVSSTQKIRN
jgi:hypothetical protein